MSTTSFVSYYSNAAKSQGGKELQESAARTMLAPGPPPSVTTCDEAVVGAEVVAGRDYGGRRAWRGAGERAKARSRSLFGHAGLRVRRAGPGSRETTHGRVRPGDVDGGAGLFPAREVASRLRCRCPRTRAPGTALTGRTKHTATAIRQPVRPRAAAPTSRWRRRPVDLRAGSTRSRAHVPRTTTSHSQSQLMKTSKVNVAASVAAISQAAVKRIVLH